MAGKPEVRWEYSKPDLQRDGRLVILALGMAKYELPQMCPTCGCKDETIPSNFCHEAMGTLAIPPGFRVTCSRTIVIALGVSKMEATMEEFLPHLKEVE